VQTHRFFRGLSIRGYGFAVALFAAWPAVAPSAGATALDDYIAAPDASYAWSLNSTITGTGYTAKVLDLTSQTWRSADDFKAGTFSPWTHWLTVIKPSTITTDTAFLWINGGSNSVNPPGSVDTSLRDLALSTGSVVIDLRTVPNEPLSFAGESFSRSEDAIIAYTWDKFLTTGDPTWPAQLPMTKSAVRAMDAAQAFLASPAGGSIAIHDFVISGGSKRGWTTWLTAAVDNRVSAIAPAVIDLLNIEESFIHHWESYGFWAPAVSDYVNAGIMNWAGTPQLRALYDVVDPYVYRDRLTMPKFQINSAGDQFFLPDSAQFYFGDLQGPKYLRYVPNTDHSLAGSDAGNSLQAYYDALLDGRPLPEFTWTLEADGSIHVQTVLGTPSSVKLWQATNPNDRDFRLLTIGPAYTSSTLTDLGGGLFVGGVPDPAAGWTSFFIELTYPSGGPYPFKFTTQVSVAGPPGPFLGDVNSDGVVNIFDINFISARWGEAGPYGDANHDGIINIFDVNLISSNWTTSPSSVGVPEPGSALLAAIAFAAVCTATQRRRR